MSIQAQYIPNSNFEQWESAGNTYQSSNGNSMRKRPGEEPTSWEGSSINQSVKVVFNVEKQETLIFKSSKNGNAVKLHNKWVGAAGIGANAPAFISFATPWVYAVSDVGACDGGVYGGTKLTHRPDAIKGLFNRSGGTGENAHIIVYLWKGTFKNDIKSNKSGDVQNNTDRAVMGKVESSDASGKRIASCDYSFASTNGWEELTIPLNYNYDEAPEMMNVIISSGDYWTRGNVKENSVLEADDVQFVYYSELSSLKYGGKEYYSKGKTDFNIDQLYDESKLKIISNGKGAKIEKKYDTAANKLTITIKGDDFAVNNSNKHVYTVTFKKPEVPKPELSSLIFDGKNYLRSGETSYTIDAYYDASKLKLETKSQGASIEKNYVESTCMLTITVKGSEFATNASHKAVYKVKFKELPGVAYSELSSLEFAGKEYYEVGKIAYTVNDVYDESKLKIESNGSDATIEKKFNAASCVLTITIKGRDFAENSSNKHVYLVAFKKASAKPTPTPTPTPTPEPDTDVTPEPDTNNNEYTPAFTGTKTSTHNRWINSISLASPMFDGNEANSLTVDNSGELCFNDYTGTVTMKAMAGETVTVGVNIGDASWINACVYIDADKNGFTAGIEEGSDWKPTGDLVSYSFYNNDGDDDNSGWNSVGKEIVGGETPDARSTVALPSFTMPTKAGVYRMRVKMDWCNIDPSGDQDGKFGDFMENGGQIVDFMVEVVKADPNAVNYTPSFTGEKTREGRWIKNITLNSDKYSGEKANSLKVDNSKKLCYNDCTKSVTMKAVVGETVTMEVNIGTAKFMNAYVYIDADKNGFTAGIEGGSDWMPTGDLMTYSFYNNDAATTSLGWNSAGEEISSGGSPDARSTVELPSFTMPTKAGVYRMRVKMDWCNIDPNGDQDGKFGDFMKNGGQIVDFMIEVFNEDGTPGVEEEEGPSGIENVELDNEYETVVKGIYDMQGRKIDEITKPGLYIINGKKTYVK